MFTKINQTAFPPKKPMMVWDGECSFCKYWITNWHSKTKNKIEYITLQEKASYFEDIPLKEFKKASRLIETDGKVYSGPNSVFRLFTYFDKNHTSWHRWYTNSKWFAEVCDHTYNWIAKHRPFMFAMTKVLFGKNPLSLKPYWLLILLLFLLAVFCIGRFL